MGVRFDPDFAITAATQTSLLNAIAAYNATIGKPGVSKIEGGQNTQQLKALFKTAEAALANMDAAVEIVRLTQVNFYNGYQKARKVTVTGTGSISVKGLVTDASTGLPVKGVAVSFSLDSGAAKAKATDGKPVVVKSTGEKGRFNLNRLPAGMYAVTLQKNGFADQVTTIAVSDGELTKLNIQLARI